MEEEEYLSLAHPYCNLQSWEQCELHTGCVANTYRSVFHVSACIGKLGDLEPGSDQTLLQYR